MDWKLSFAAFAAIFLAEMGDKTQLAVISMTASSGKPFSVFIGATVALTLVTLLGALAGGIVTRWVPEQVLTRLAAVLFVAIGIWTWFKS
jgi:putative Ca2+/H+ antiporter (TMEM165/GDT1 family)